MTCLTTGLSIDTATCLITELITNRATCFITGLTTGSTTGLAKVLITCLINGLATLPANLDDSRNVDIATRPDRFHSDRILERAGIPETDAGGFVRRQFGCVAACHPPTEIILARQLLVPLRVEKNDSHWCGSFVDPPNFIAGTDSDVA